MKARSDIRRVSDGAVEGGQNQKKFTSIGHPNRISGCPEDIKKMYSTSDPNICRTSDGLPYVMWAGIADIGQQEGSASQRPWRPTESGLWPSATSSPPESPASSRDSKFFLRSAFFFLVDVVFFTVPIPVSSTGVSISS
ncbi:hypothetical protein OUZ56_033588 [Daphnia magna]|uniref:Uncharacterized protein n=1 Tax=Daphnia magna TaxID=35525 RepID=A0ABR0BAV6_9CRUS|nr:hypothetical protein OUZ56_033588 [Daphnia magna]